MHEARALSLTGLAMRAGQVISGDSQCEREVRAGRAAFVLMDAGVSKNTRDKYVSLCEVRGIPLYEISTDALGLAIGKPNRMLAVMAKGNLADRVAALLEP